MQSLSRTMQEQLMKPVVSSGNGAVVYVPKQWIGSQVIVTRPFEHKSLKEKIIQPLIEHMGKVIGIYLYGSYARAEQTAESDVDVLVIAKEKFSIKPFDNISYSISTLEEVKRTIKENSILIMPFLMEAKAILNEQLLEELKAMKVQMNFNWFVETTGSILEKHKLILADIEKTAKPNEKLQLGNLIYSLILRLRGIFIINSIYSGKSYSSKAFFEFLSNRLGKAETELLLENYKKIKSDMDKDAKPIPLAYVLKLFEIVETDFKSLKKFLKAKVSK